MKPSMSKVDLLLACQWWADPTRVGSNRAGLPARFGSAVHEQNARLLRDEPLDVSLIPKWGDDVQVNDVVRRATEGVAELRRWLTKSNPFDIDFTSGGRRMEIEHAYAYDLIADTARRIDGPTVEDHQYLGIGVNELPGTADVVVFPPFNKGGALKGTLLVIDHKTGIGPYRPTEMGQLWAIALAAARVSETKVTHVLLAVLHMAERGVPVVYCEGPFGEDDLQQARKRIRRAWNRIGDGALRPGPHCVDDYCPAIGTCPSSGNALVELRGNASKAITTPEQAGMVHMKLQEYRKRFKAIDDSINDELKAFIRANGPVPRPDGRSTILQKKSRRNLSMSTIMRGLGKVAGERRIARLEKDGCITTSEWEELGTEKDE